LTKYQVSVKLIIGLSIKNVVVTYINTPSSRHIVIKRELNHLRLLTKQWPDNHLPYTPQGPEAPQIPAQAALQMEEDGPDYTNPCK
jgi:hypothetical protein